MRSFSNFCVLFAFIHVSEVFGDVCLTRVSEAKDLSKSCADQLKFLCQNHTLLLRFWDSSSRLLHSGLQASNNFDLGNYDECLEIDVGNHDQEVRVLGKFCAITYATALPKILLTEAVALWELLRIPGLDNYINPKLKTDVDSKEIELVKLYGSLCIPNQCTLDEFSKVFRHLHYPTNRIPTIPCVTKEDTTKLTRFEKGVTIAFLIIFGLVLSCTLIHTGFHYGVRDEPHDFVKAFSMIYNGKKLLSVSTDRTNQIQCIHGMRFLCMAWVVAGHTYATFRIMPVQYVRNIQEFGTHLYDQYILSANYAVDTFFFLSGFLFCYLYLKGSKDYDAKKQLSGIPLLYVHRYLRLTPAVGALFFASLSFLKLLSDGPVWLEAVEVTVKPCREVWWKYFLYIQNYNKFNNLCWLQTWYLSADMQMFIIAPFVMIPTALYFRKRLYTIIGILCSIALSFTVLTIGLQLNSFESNITYHTHAHMCNYLIGIAAGVVFYKVKNETIKINKYLNVLIWLLTFSVMMFLILYMNEVQRHETDHVKNTVFYALRKPFWCVCLAWILISCYLGYGGIIDAFLSHPFFQVGSKLSYSMYIVHGMVLIIRFGKLRSYAYVDHYIAINLFLSNLCMTFFVAVLWNFCFEAPMIMLDKMLFEWLGSRMEGKKNRIPQN